MVKKNGENKKRESNLIEKYKMSSDLAYSMMNNTISEYLMLYNHRFNTSRTRKEIVDGISMKIEEQKRQFLDDDINYEVICNETNNPDIIVDIQHLIVDVDIIINHFHYILHYHLGGEEVKKPTKIMNQIFTDEDPYGEEDWGEY